MSVALVEVEVNFWLSTETVEVSCRRNSMTHTWRPAALKPMDGGWTTPLGFQDVWAGDVCPDLVCTSFEAHWQSTGNCVLRVPPPV